MTMTNNTGDWVKMTGSKVVTVENSKGERFTVTPKECREMTARLTRAGWKVK